MDKRRVFLILQAGVCITLAILLAAGAVALYAEGSARKADNPLEPIYTAENVGEKLGQILPLILLFAGLLIAGILLSGKDSGKPAKADGPVYPKNEGKHSCLIRTVLVVAAVVFIVLGILNGSALDVLAKAIHICTECVGFG